MLDMMKNICLIGLNNLAAKISPRWGYDDFAPTELFRFRPDGAMMISLLRSYLDFAPMGRGYDDYAYLTTPTAIRKSLSIFRQPHHLPYCISFLFPLSSK
jgi:hypothetical protein